MVRDRFTGTAVLTAKQAAEIGALGYVARASGLDIDARRDHPARHEPAPPPAVVRTSGDVLARFQVRADEYQHSTAQIAALAEQIEDREPACAAMPAQPPGPAAVRAPVPGGCSGVGVAEGWRGTIVHRVELGADGRLRRVRIVDPSFLTWPALPVALAGAIVPDFPLANKSFNLSYAGNDL